MKDFFSSWFPKPYYYGSAALMVGFINVIMNFHLWKMICEKNGFFIFFVIASQYVIKIRKMVHFFQIGHYLDWRCLCRLSSAPLTKTRYFAKIILSDYTGNVSAMIQVFVWQSQEVMPIMFHCTNYLHEVFVLFYFNGIHLYNWKKTE